MIPPGLAAPPCVKMITNWFDPKERGFWWSVWHASINLGGFLCPFFAGTLAESFGWRYGMLGPGFLGLATVFLCYLAMSDGPTDGAVEKSVKGEAQTKPDPEVSLMDGIILNPVQWALGVAYMLVYVCRQGLSVWGIFYLMQMGALSPAKAAALFSGFELGGFLGNLTAGTLSDLLLRRARPGAGDVGQRAKASDCQPQLCSVSNPELVRSKDFKIGIARHHITRIANQPYGFIPTI